MDRETYFDKLIGRLVAKPAEGSQESKDLTTTMALIPEEFNEWHKRYIAFLAAEAMKKRGGPRR